MSFSSTVPVIHHTGNGSATTFSFPFRISAEAEIKVIKTLISSGSETLLVLTTDYTVSGLLEDGGSITLTASAPSSLYRISILLITTETQPTSFRNQGTYYPNTHEEALDRLARVLKHHKNLLNRAPQMPAHTDTDTIDNELPAPSAGMGIGWNSTEDGFANISSLTGVATTAFTESLLDDASAAAFMATMSAALTEDTAPATGDFIESYDISAATGKKILLAALVQGALNPNWMGNVGLANATTTNANDSIKIQGAAAALSATNPLYINLPTVSSPGRTTRFTATADVTFNLTGAHFGYGTKGDVTDMVHRLYAVNNNGALVFMVHSQVGLRSIADTDTSATATSVTTAAKGLVSSALTAGTWPCREIGFFLTDFDDTGGAAEDLHVVQSGAGEIESGVKGPEIKDVCMLTGYGSISGEVITFTTQTVLTGNAFTVGSLSTVTITKPGLYSCTVYGRTDTSNDTLTMTKNSTTDLGETSTTHIAAAWISVNNRGASATGLVWLVVGDVLRICRAGSGLASNVRFLVTRIPT